MDQREDQQNDHGLQGIEQHLQEGAAGSGPYPAIVEDDPTLPTHAIYRPQNLIPLPQVLKLPIVVWGNGGCTNSSLPFRNFLLEIASHGFLVIAIGPVQTQESEQVVGSTHASQLLDAIDWAITEYSRPQSDYAGKLAIDKVAVMGMSCGGLQALAVSPDPRITTSVIWNSGLLTAPPPAHLPMPHIDKSVLGQLHAPIAYFLGGVEDIAYSNALDDVARIDRVPLFFGSIDVGHGGTFAEANGGEFGRVGAAWLKWRLLDDQESGTLFAGANCSLSTDQRWQVIKKQML